MEALPWPVFLVLVLLGSYLLGSIPFGYFAGRLKGIDIREHGSGNIGATNVVRVLGKGIGLPVFALDMLKGAVPVWVTQQLAPSVSGLAQTPWLLALAAVLGGLGAVLGHTFTCWLNFKGGKGVATSAGVMLALAPLALLAAFIVWLSTVLMTRYVGFASVMAGLALPVATWISGQRAGTMNGPVLVLTSLIAGLVLVRHRGNLQRMLAGTEPKAKWLRRKTTTGRNES